MAGQEGAKTPLQINSTLTHRATEPARLYASEETRAQYGKLFDVIAPLAPGLHVMLVTSKDIGAPLTGPLANYNWGSRFSCSGAEGSPREQIDASAAMEPMQNNLFQQMEGYTHGPHPFLQSAELQRSVSASLSGVSNLISGAVAYALLRDNASATYIPNDLKHVRTRAAMVTMTVEPRLPIDQAKAHSGLEEKYLSNIDGTPMDYALFDLGHEILGHANNAHRADADAKYSCIALDPHVVDEGIRDDSAADAAGAAAYRAGQKMKVVTEADVPRTVQSMRALGAFYNNSNIFSAQTNAHVNDHVTTIGYDPDAKNYTSDFNLAAMDGVGSLPLLINSYADVLAGFVYAQHVKEKIKTEPGKFTAEDISKYEALPSSPEAIPENMEKFAEIGVYARGVAPVEPEKHYAAMAFLVNHHGFDALCARLKPEYARAMDDLLADYMKAVDRNARGLKDEKSIQDIEKTLSGKVDFGAMSEALFGTVLPRQQTVLGTALRTALDPDAMPTSPEYTRTLAVSRVRRTLQQAEFLEEERPVQTREWNEKIQEGLRKYIRSLQADPAWGYGWTRQDGTLSEEFTKHLGNRVKEYEGLENFKTDMDLQKAVRTMKMFMDSMDSLKALGIYAAPKVAGIPETIMTQPVTAQTGVGMR